MRVPTSYFTRLGKSPSALVLILANLIPLGGVIFFRWSAFNVVFLFWLENIVIGIFSILKMLVYGAVGSPPEDNPPVPRIELFLGNLLQAPFLLLHYGIVCYIHGVIVFVLLRDALARAHGNPFEFDLVANVRAELTSGLWTALAALVISHGFSFGVNFLRNREYQKVKNAQLMMEFYGRLAVLHLAILLGAFAIMKLHSPLGLVALLVVLKIGLDLALHLKERLKWDLPP